MTGTCGADCHLMDADFFLLEDADRDCTLRSILIGSRETDPNWMSADFMLLTVDE